jgi:hypothetical protein
MLSQNNMSIVVNEPTYSIYDIISKFDNYSDVSVFLKTNKLTKNLSKYDIDQINWQVELNKRLELLKIDPKVFCECLRKHKMSITGSFILQVIKGVDYQNHDIDIFIKSITPEIICELQTILGAGCKYRMKKDKDIGSIYGNIKNKKLHNIVSQLVDFERSNQQISCIVQLIEPHEEYGTIVKYIESFDLDVCKNFYDGSHFYIENLDNIMSNKSVYDESHLDDKCFATLVKRLTKYNNRGFDIMFSTSLIRKFQKEKNTVQPHIFGNNMCLLNGVTEFQESKFDFIMKCFDQKLSFN